jgi:hypothetical protein
MYNAAKMRRLDHWPFFTALATFLILLGVLRSAWTTRLDGFTIDEPWHITAGVAYLRTGEYYLNPEHPPLVKLVSALAAPSSVFHFTAPPSLHDKTEERKFVIETMYKHNDADAIQSRVRPVMYTFNGLLLLLFALVVFRVFGGFIALGALLFALVDPTVAAHWPVVMTDLPVGLLSVTCVLLLVYVLRHWTWLNLSMFAIALGLALSVKHSGLISFAFAAAMGLVVLLCQFHRDLRRTMQRICAFLLALMAAVAILWSTYGFHYKESGQPIERFNRTLTQKMVDLRSPVWRAALTTVTRSRLLPRPYVWGLADIVRAGMEGRAHSDYDFGRLTFMERRPLLFPGYVAVKLPIPLLLLSAFGCVLVFRPSQAQSRKMATMAVLALAASFLLILARSGAGYAGVRHALTIYFSLAILAGFAVEYLVNSPRRVIGQATLALALSACSPALTVLRPWEYHNVLGGGTRNAFRYFRNDSVDLGQRDKEIADYCRHKLEPLGEVPYVLYTRSFEDPDLRTYRHLKIKLLDDPDFLPPAVLSGTILIDSIWTTPLIWSLTAPTIPSDYSLLSRIQPTERFGNLLVFRGNFYLPAARADALLSQANDLLAELEPDLAKAEHLLKEGLALRPNDFAGWMILGNVYVLRGDSGAALAAYQKSRDWSPAGPVRDLLEKQLQLLSTQPIQSVPPVRDPGIE